MSVDLTALADASSTATSLANIILVSPQKNVGIKPQAKAGTANAAAIQSFLFHYEGENTITLSSDITDHFVENNSSIQDQIAIKPEIITMHGFIGELNDVPPPALAALKFLADKLTLVSPFAPVLSATAIIAYNKAQQAYQTAAQVASAGVAAWSVVAGPTQLQIGENGAVATLNPLQTKQQVAYTQLAAYWSNRQLFTVQTPWAIYKDMAIQTIRAVQDEDTRMVSDFEVTFKRIRFASTIVSKPPLQQQGRLSAQASSPVNQGNSTPAQSSGLLAVFNWVKKG